MALLEQETAPFVKLLLQCGVAVSV